jgi:hypothetical protein
MLGVIMRGAAGIGVVLMFFAMLVRGARRMHRLRTVMHMRGGGRRDLGHQAGRSVAKRQRHAGREHAKQIEKGDKPPRFGAHWPRQANEHGGNLMPSADFAKGDDGRCPITTACPISRQCGLTLGDYAPKLGRPWQFLPNSPEIPICSFPTRAGHGCGLPWPC